MHQESRHSMMSETTILYICNGINKNHEKLVFKKGL